MFVIGWRSPRSRLCLAGLTVCPGQWLAEDMLLVNQFRQSRASVPTSAYLTSEGLAHHAAAVRVWLGSRYEEICRRFLQSRVCDDMHLIHVEAPIELALDRVCQRGTPRSWPQHAGASRAAIGRVLAEFADAIDHSISQFTAAGASLARLDNSQGTSDLASQVDELADALAGRDQAQHA